jgi:guanosine-3',5'-bis(diphosphate) 3'-pyrophosphohydrolase
MSEAPASAGGAGLWQAAAAKAARAHRHQMRKDGKTPYASHTTRVAMTVVLEFGVTDPVTVAAALLHDTIEDTTTDYDDLADDFGPEVASIVAALTKNMALPDTEREAEYDARLARADWRARLIKLADQFDNLCDLSSYPPDQRESQRVKALARCERALALARADADNPVMARACERLRAIMPGGERR